MAKQLTDRARAIAEKVFKGEPVTTIEAESLLIELGASPLNKRRGKGAHRLYRLPKQSRPYSIPWHSAKQELSPAVQRSFKQVLRLHNVTKTGEVEDDES